MKIAEIYSINISNMNFFANIGVGELEREVGEDIAVSVELTATTDSDAFENDQIANTIDYSEVYAKIKKAVSTPAKLLEHLAYNIGQSIMEINGILAAQISVTKKNPPMGSDGANATINIYISK